MVLIEEFCDWWHVVRQRFGCDGAARKVQYHAFLLNNRDAHGLHGDEVQAHVNAYWPRVVAALTTYRRHA